MSERITQRRLAEIEHEMLPRGVAVDLHELADEIRRLRALILAHHDTGWGDDLPAAQAFFAEAEAIRAEKG